MEKIKITTILNEEESSSVVLPLESFNKKASLDFIENAINSKFCHNHISVIFKDCVIVVPCSYYFFPLLEMAIDKFFSVGEA